VGETIAFSICNKPFINDVIYFKVFISEKCFKMLKEDSVQIPTQRSQIPSFCLDGLVMHSDAYQCLEDLNSSRLRPSGRHGNTSGCTLEFETLGQHRPDVVLIMKITWSRVATVRMQGQHRQT